MKPELQKILESVPRKFRNLDITHMVNDLKIDEVITAEELARLNSTPSISSKSVVFHSMISLKSDDKFDAIINVFRLHDQTDVAEYLESERTKLGSAAAASSQPLSLRDRQTTAFKKVRPQLMKDLEVSDILPYFRARDILTEDTFDEIRREARRDNRFEMFSRQLLRRDQWWDALIGALKDNCQTHLVKLLEDALALQ